MCQTEVDERTNSPGPIALTHTCRTKRGHGGSQFTRPAKLNIFADVDKGFAGQLECRFRRLSETYRFRKCNALYDHGSELIMRRNGVDKRPDVSVEMARQFFNGKNQPIIRLNMRSTLQLSQLEDPQSLIPWNLYDVEKERMVFEEWPMDRANVLVAGELVITRGHLLAGTNHRGDRVNLKKEIFDNLHNMRVVFAKNQVDPLAGLFYISLRELCLNHPGNVSRTNRQGVPTTGCPGLL